MNVLFVAIFDRLTETIIPFQLKDFDDLALFLIPKRQIHLRWRWDLSLYIAEVSE